MNKKDSTYVTNDHPVARAYWRKSAKYVFVMILFIARLFGISQ